MPGEKGVYSDSVLRAMDLNQEILDQLKAAVRQSVVEDIKDLVERCLR